MADTDILTLAEGRATLAQGSTTVNDTEIALLISAASSRIDRGVGPVVRRAIVGETHDGHGTHISLDQWPVYSVTILTEDLVTLTTFDYLLDGARGQVLRNDGSGSTSYSTNWARGASNVVVDYVAGRFADTATVDSFYKWGTMLLLKHYYRAQQGQVSGLGVADFDVPQVAFPSFGVPNAVKEHFGPLWREGKGGFAAS